ncbi:hypothetical protein LPW36_14810 [Jinshanibacter sp. LJY008]|uniref:Uncharacterized protein n=1 Tax=Limnobaculum eriocheiris TaxID=2897391 RepID=A0A9X1SL64_9GAMM|nr:hypothetical protein [Limnobaculum eriocheiris]MCD1127248.1 hypothetical protein [Limnobaculum eriocheiris]
MGGISLPQIIGIVVAVALVIFWQKRQREKMVAQQQELENKQKNSLE